MNHGKSRVGDADLVDEFMIDNLMNQRHRRSKTWRPRNVKPVPKKPFNYDGHIDSDHPDLALDQFGFDRVIGVAHRKFSKDCKSHGGKASTRACATGQPSVMPSMTFGKGSELYCCRARTRKETHNTLAVFRASCKKKNGAIYKGSNCPRQLASVDQSRSLGAICCAKPAKPIVKPVLVKKQAPPKQTLEAFRDKCTTLGGIIWNKCKPVQVTLMPKTTFSNKVSKVCCGDPATINREMYKSFVRKCFTKMGIVYANRGCPANAVAVIPQARFGVLEPVVCCK